MLKRYKFTALLLLMLATYLFTSVSASAAQNVTTKATSTNYQFGASAFDPKQTFSQFSGKLKVQETGDYTIVTWIDSLTLDGQHVYMSVAKKNKWIFRGKEVLTVKDHNDIDKTIIIFAENYIFYGNNDDLKVAVINLENGKVASEKVLQTWTTPLAFHTRSYYPVVTNNHSGVLLEDVEGKYKLYLAGELSKPILINDPKNVIIQQIYSTQQDIVLTTKRDRLVFNKGIFGSTVFNIKKNDMTYDSQGKELTYKGVTFYVGGKFYGFNYNYMNNIAKIETYDENFKLLSVLQYKTPKEYQNYPAGITVNNNVMRHWSFNSYQHTNSLQVTNFNLIK
ncbi:hypothetical protein PghCCS26_50780 [Paenibacillus glycanilyticus]|uniref:Uncharacterized protein n=1 Tax=Paenibacillus glycanilyticus TaxID=126569 RepID=A0ABQ6NTR4_9BACL|nr:hypothetical protein [Paenibacillus glycanilyticus]GMK47948.1 hypothetical protein PghCCS26_50780 [Paenibacillus glycanilyticus]